MITTLRFMQSLWLCLMAVLLAQPLAAEMTPRWEKDKTSKFTLPTELTLGTVHRDRAMKVGSAGPTSLAETIITVSPASLTFLNTTQLPGSNTKTYTVSATGLTSSDVRISASSPYVISASSGGPYTRDVVLTGSNTGTLDPTTIYVALLSSASGTFVGTITNSNGSTTTTVPLSGTVLNPSLQISSTTLSSFVTTTGNPSISQTYTLTALSQTGGYVTAPTGYEIRTGNSAFGPMVSIPPSLYPITIPVEVRLTGAAAGPVSGVIRHQFFNSSNQSIENVAVSGTVADPGAPTIVVSASSLTVVDYTTYPGTLPASYTVAAVGLAEGLEIIAPSDYYVSAGGLSGQAIIIHTTNGILPPTRVSVSLVTSAPGQYNGTIVNRDWNRTAQTTIAISGTALNQTVIVKPTVLSNFITTLGTPSASQSYTLTTRGGLPVFVSPPADFEVRSGNNPFSPGFTIEASPVFRDTPIDIRLKGTTAGPVATSVTHDTYFHSSHVLNPLAVSGFVFGNTNGLTVLHRDVDNYANNNAIQPLVQLQNQSTVPLSLSAITLRYYLTVEGAAVLSNLSINYAQVGNQNVRLRYVPLQPAQQGAAGYVEYSFTPAAGSVAPGASSGAIQSYFAKSDYGPLNELDDYSYAPVRNQLAGNLRITAYYNGVLISGLEPGTNTQIRAIRALTESKNGPSATQINTYLTVRNEGNVPVNYGDLRARYYFTSDGNERLQVEVDEGQVQTRLVALSQPVGGANYYLEIYFTQSGQLTPGASAGRVRYRISKPDGGRFNQTNDYSYQEQPAESSSNGRVVVYVGADRVWGNEPSGSARLASMEPAAALAVRVLGNPVRGDVLRVQIKGGDSGPLQLQLVSTQGRVITQQQIAAPQAVEQHDLSLAGQGPGVFLLQVNTPTQSRTIRVLKAE